MKNSTKNKLLIAVGVIILIALLFGSYKCGERSVTKTVGRDTLVTVRIDTVETNPEPDTIIQTKTVAGELVYVDTGYVPDPVSSTDTLKELTRLQDVERIFNQKVAYKDSAEGSNWKAVVVDTAYKNRLQKPRQWIITKTDTTIKETTVLTKNPLRISLAASNIGNLKSPFYAQGGGFSVQFPKGDAVDVQLMSVKGHKPMVLVTKKWVIRWGRKAKP